MRIRAFHCIWTAPFYARHHQDQEFALEDFEILTMVLSALKWRELNGSIKLYTDQTGAEYVSRLRLTALWDRGTNADALAEANRGNINARSFWAAGKLIALGHEPAPCAMIDTDFVVWRPLEELSDSPDLVVVHREPLYEGVYLPPRHLKTARGYAFDPEWSWTEPACNTAFAFFGNDDLRRYYVSEALRFMDGNTEEAKELISQMVFAEQRLLGMCAARKGIEIRELMPCDPQQWLQQDSFTHVWGYKDQMRNDDSKRQVFCQRCMQRIVGEYPDWHPVLARIAELQRYVGGGYRPAGRAPTPSEHTYWYRFASGGYGLLP